MFQLFLLVVVVALSTLMSLGGNGEVGVTDQSLLGVLPLGLFALATVIPALAVTVRRFHDQDKSGWLILLQFIPYVGWLIVFIFMLLDGTRGPNRFGDDPKAPAPDFFG